MIMKKLEDRMAAACPKCGSDAFQALPLLYASGTSDIHLHGIAGGIGSNLSAGVGSIRMSGTQASKLAQILTPPEQMKVEGFLSAFFTALFGAIFGGLLFYGIICIFFSLGKIGGWATFGGLSLLFFYSMMSDTKNKNRTAQAYNQDQFPRDYARWRASALCSKCGAVFNLEKIIDAQVISPSPESSEIAGRAMHILPSDG